MQVKEVFTYKDNATGRELKVHVSEEELLEIVQAGLFLLLQQGYINFKGMTEVPDIELPPDATAQ